MTCEIDLMFDGLQPIVGWEVLSIGHIAPTL